MKQKKSWFEIYPDNRQATNLSIAGGAARLLAILLAIPGALLALGLLAAACHALLRAGPGWAVLYLLDEMDEELMRQRQQALLQIVILSDRATRDPSVSEQDLIDLATYLDDTMTNGDFTDEERQLFMRCYFILQARYFEMIGRPDLINPID